ncbi:MAG TPA: ADOP family duplicated permease [Vicinamibacterales bacterium]|nr:ADOP family duplicated permease [Vicinamibacterales bacterium]
MTLERASIRFYRALARALPAEFRDEYGRELSGVAEAVVRDAGRSGGRGRLLRTVPALLANLALHIAVEHARDASRDVRYATRLLARSPGFAAASVLCLAIGIGLTAAMYAQIQSTMLRGVPGVADPGGVVRFQQPTAFGNVDELRSSGQFASLAAYSGPVPVALRSEGHEPERVWGHLATADYFDVLGVRASRGRVFGLEEASPGASAVVISDRLWRTRFAASSDIVGRPIRVNGHLMTVAGVTPPGFLGAAPMTAAADIWIPTTADTRVVPELAGLETSRAAAFDVIGRLVPGIAADQAEPALEALVRRLEVLHGDPGRDSPEARVRLLPGGRMFPVRNEDLPRAIGFPIMLVSLVLLMACGNVANLVLARSSARRREIAVRLSLGAGRGRIVRQLLTENLLLVILGAAAGGVFTLWLLALFDRMRPVIPGYVHYDVQFDWLAFLAAAAVAAGSTLLFGTAPALRASRDAIYAGLKAAAPTTLAARRRFGMRNVLVFQQVTVSIVLVLLTGFVVVGWRRAAQVDVGFEPANLYFVSLDPVRDGYSPARARQFFDRLPDQLRGIAGVTHVSLAQTLPLAMSGSEMILNAKSDFATGTRLLGATRADRVGPEFFETVGVPIVRGRAFTRADQRDDSSALVINEAMARRGWPEEDPLGQVVELEGRAWQVVGIVGDIRSAFPLAPTLPALYRPVTPAGFDAPARHGVTVAVRVVPGFDAPTRLRRAVADIDPDVTIVQIRRMTEELEQAAFLASVATFVYGGMGVFGLLLASIGLAGVTAYAVSRRTHEIGIRMALGARRANVLWLVLREGAAITLAGTVAGLALALLITRALASVLDALAEATRTSMSDPLLLAGAPALLAVIALAACYLPARRSTRINPVTALRAE